MKKYIIIFCLIFLPSLSFASGTAYTDIAGTTHYSDGSTSYTDVAGTTHFSDGTTLYTDIAGTTHYSNGSTSSTDISGTTHFSDGTTAYTDVAGITHYSDGSTSYTDVAGTTHYSGNFLKTCPKNYSLDSVSGKCKTTSTSTQNLCNYPAYASCSEDMYSLLQSQKTQATNISQFRGLGADDAYIQSQILKISNEYDQKLATCRQGIDTYKEAVSGYNQCIKEKTNTILSSILPSVKVLPPPIPAVATTDTSCKTQFGKYAIQHPTKIGYCGCEDGYYFSKSEPSSCIPIDSYYCSLDKENYSETTKECVPITPTLTEPIKISAPANNSEKISSKKTSPLKINTPTKLTEKIVAPKIEPQNTTITTQETAPVKQSFFKRIGTWFVNLFR